MAKAVLINKRPVITKKIENDNFFITTIKSPNPIIKINYDLPFRIKFTNIMVPGYGPGNVPPIGIAIVGVNNYIL
jgi:hypothetical protein